MCLKAKNRRKKKKQRLNIERTGKTIMSTEMVWLTWVMSILFVFFFIAFCLKFKITAELKYPFHLDLDVSLHFLGLKKSFPIRQSESKTDSKNPQSTHAEISEASNEKISIAKITNINIQSKSISGNSFLGQSGFVILPIPFQNKFKVAWLKFLLEIPVWKLLCLYVLKVLKRIFFLMHLRLEQISIGLQDVNTLGTVAAYWSSISGVFPKLQSPIAYHFNEPDLRFQIRLRSQFNLLQMLLLLFMVIFTLPWFSLLTQFIRCWRNPGLNLWQRSFTTLIAR